MTQRTTLAVRWHSILAFSIAIALTFFACSNGNDETPNSETRFGANASSIKASGDTLFVILQRLENFSATKTGLLTRIKASTKTAIDTIPLKLYNPSSSILSNGKLYVSSQKYNEDFSVDLEKSGVEVVDLATGASEVLATGTELGGGANGIALDEASQTLYVSVYVAFGDAPVKPVNLANKSVGGALPGITDSFGGLVFDNTSKKLFVGDRDFISSGVKVYDPATELTTTINDVAKALPPYSLAIMSGSESNLLLNFTSDYETGELRWMALNSTNFSDGAIDFWQDSKISTGGGSIFVLSNYPGTLACILPEKIGDKSAIKQNSLDAKAPYDVAVIGSKGYIALNDADYVQTFDIGTCALGEKINLPIGW
jgi:hypothetical protein